MITRIALSLLVALSLVACGPDPDQQRAKAEHEKRLAWQKQHSKEYVAQRQAERAKAAREAAYAAEHTPCKEFGRGLEGISGIGNLVASYNCREVGGGVIAHVTIRDSA